jgi:hypothetical protein
LETWLSAKSKPKINFEEVWMFRCVLQVKRDALEKRLGGMPVVFGNEAEHGQQILSCGCRPVNQQHGPFSSNPATPAPRP